MLQKIVEETNRYATQNPITQSSHMKAWCPDIKKELENFLGLSILMGHVQKGDLQSYWSTALLLHTPIFDQIISCDRYIYILRCLHFHDNEEIANHSLVKMKSVIEYVQSKFLAVLPPGKHLCIDGSLLLWNGRLRFKQYIPFKRHRFGIKLYMIVDCEAGFVLGFVVYTGADTEYHFLQPYFYKGHLVYIDNWYTSPTLVEFLHDRDTVMCSTVKENRKGMPKLKSKLVRGKVQVSHSDEWMSDRWEDEHSVRMLTSVHELEFCATAKKSYLTNEDNIKPRCVHECNENMVGIDNFDRQLSVTETVRKTMKWYRKLFFHLIDLCLSNPHV